MIKYYLCDDCDSIFTNRDQIRKKVQNMCPICGSKRFQEINYEIYVNCESCPIREFCEYSVHDISPDSVSNYTELIRLATINCKLLKLLKIKKNKRGAEK